MIEEEMMEGRIAENRMLRGCALRKGLAWLWERWFEIVIFGVFIATLASIPVTLVWEWLAGGR